ncbi:MAG TPA: hypothetical protein VF172_10885 [Nitrososphaera sp.]|jgi:hypothetical protein
MSAPAADNNGKKTTDAELKEALQGKTLQVYLMLLDSHEPIGAREVQRRLDYSSVNVAVHHLEKLCRVGLAVKDEHGRYLVSKKVGIGIMELFMNVGRVRFPRLLFYAAFFAALAIMYFVTAPIVIGRDSVYVMVFAVAGTALLAYEAFKVWRQI